MKVFVRVLTHKILFLFFSIDLARLVLQKIHSTMMASDDPTNFLIETLPPLTKIATTFPAQLAEHTISFLLGTILLPSCKGKVSAECMWVGEDRSVHGRRL